MGIFRAIKGVLLALFSRDSSVVVRVFGLTIFTLTGIGLNLLSPFVFNAAVNSLTTNTSFTIYSLTLPPLAMVGVFCGNWAIIRFIPAFRNLMINRLAVNATHKLMQRLLKAIMKMPLNYHITIPMGRNTELLKICYNNTEEFAELLLSQIIPTTLEVFIAIGILSYLYGLPMAGALGGILSLYVFYNFLSVSWTGRAKNASVNSLVETQGKVGALLTNYESIHSFNNLKQELQTIKQEFAGHGEFAIRSSRKQDLMSVVRAAIISMGFAGVVFYIAGGIVDGKALSNELVVMIYYLLQFSSPLISFGEAINKCHAAIVGLTKVFALIETQEQLTAANELKIGKQLIAKNFTIKFQDVTYSYDKDTPVLDTVSFKIPPGKKTAIVGRSGSGKTTIGKLIFRFYDLQKAENDSQVSMVDFSKLNSSSSFRSPKNLKLEKQIKNFDSGVISIGDEDIREFNIASIRSKIAVVSQFPALFNNTLAYNIKYGSPTATDEEMWAAIRLAGLEEYVNSQPLKLETPVGERGLKISGGQLQRVAIARAILRKPEFMIFDEATSALDPETEAEIQKSLDSLTTQITTLTITHRLGTIKNADQIIVLSKGKIVDKGTHTELIDRCREYQDLWMQYNLPEHLKMEKSEEEPKKKSSGTYASLLNVLDSDPYQEIDQEPDELIMEETDTKEEPINGSSLDEDEVFKKYKNDDDDESADLLTNKKNKKANNRCDRCNIL
jgi:ATP-binding cassette subfamily B protein